MCIHSLWFPSPAPLTWTIVLMFVYFERERESAQGRGRERGERENPKQALHCQHGAQCRAWTHEPWDHDLGQNRVGGLTTEQPRCSVFLFLFLFFERESSHRRGGAEGENPKQAAGSAQSPKMEIDTTTVISWPEPKSRVRCSISWATQVPLDHSKVNTAGWSLQQSHMVPFSPFKPLFILFLPQHQLQLYSTNTLESISGPLWYLTLNQYWHWKNWGWLMGLLKGCFYIIIRVNSTHMFLPCSWHYTHGNESLQQAL